MYQQYFACIVLLLFFYNQYNHCDDHSINLLQRKFQI